MARRGKATLQEEFYDVFADWELKDQASALRMLGEMHRQAVRRAAKTPGPAVTAEHTQVPLTAEPIGDTEVTNVANIVNHRAAHEN